MIIQHNLASLGINRQLGITNKKMASTSERLASGYRVNRASDDVAALSISEKMRGQIRGLVRAAENAKDGISFVQTGDGAMNEITNILHRMKELSIQSINDTYTDEDRACMQAEFDHLQSEIDRITKETQYNTLQVFEQHMPTYYSIQGAVQWDQGQQHLVEIPRNDLTITIPGENEGDPVRTYTIQVSAGIYTTQELISEIEDALDGLVPENPGFVLEFTKDGYCNINLEGGEDIVGVGGALSYLIYDNYLGGGLGSLIGTTQFVGNWPLNITSNNNELKFYLEDMGGNLQQVNITVPTGGYTRQQMIDYLNSQLSSKGITGVTAKEYGDHCIEIGGNDYMVTGLKGNMFALDSGATVYTSVFYDNVKYGGIVHTSGYIQGNAGYSVSDPNYGKIKINDTNNLLYIRVDADASTPYTEIELEEKEYSVQEMVDALNAAFADKGLDAEATKRLAYFNGTLHEYVTITSKTAGDGSKIEVDQTNSTSYNVLFRETKYLYSRNATFYNGTDMNEPYVLGFKSITGPVTLTDANNQIKLTVDGTTYTLSLTEKTYSNVDDLIYEINAHISDNAGINGKVVAKNDGGKIRITTAADDNGVGNILVASDSSAYKDLFQGIGVTYDPVRFPATGSSSQITLNKQIADSITINGTNNDFTLTVNGQSKSVVIPNGTYTRQQLVDQLNELLKPTSSTTINYFSKTVMGSQDPPLQGSTIPQNMKPAVVEFTHDLPSSIAIDDTNNVFTINVNGSWETIKLTTGKTYTRAELINEMNKKFANDGIGVVASLNGNKVKLQTTLEGNSAYLSVSTGASDSFMSVLAGTTTTSFAGVTVSLDASNQLTLAGNGVNISLSSSNMGDSKNIFVTETPREYVTGNPETRSRVAGTYSYVQGNSFPTTSISIDRTNKDLRFTYEYNGTTYNVNMELTENNYTFADLQTELQNKINAALGGSGKLNVTVNQSGIRLEAAQVGEDYKLSGFDGGFYTYVIRRCEEITSQQNPSVYEGRQTFNTAYIVGRKDVKNNPVTINPYVNDTLVFDFTHPDENGVQTVTTIEIKLSGGTYNGSSLVKEIQNRLNEQLVLNGFDENFIKASIGGINTGVVGSNDANALNFQMANPGENINPGNYVIDGVRGNAAFTLFYATKGEPVPAYVTGMKDLSGGVTIEPGKTEFSLTADGITYTYDIPEGEYTAQEFIDAFNQLLSDPDRNGNVSPVQALYDSEGRLKITYTTLGEHVIENITGSARGSFFFVEEGRKDEETDLLIQIGANANQTLKLERLLVNTCFMKINSITVSKSKYANKALDRLSYALEYINRAHSLYGAKQNRLDHVVAGNENTSENLQSSESKLRDADIAKEFVNYAKTNILQQAAQSMLSQANQNNEGVLALLR